ncbi:hypothetical protein [uncultured Desulfobulbus sp.]|uniref:hypothetical protein n=1 Tax=uncultured Desulfobulbus sp. TaxID=239745 RepID=UPI0029C98B4F|nr:hypothetical protein [uncultured Desulfobulbus sp.]
MAKKSISLKKSAMVDKDRVLRGTVAAGASTNDEMVRMDVESLNEGWTAILSAL